MRKMNLLTLTVCIASVGLALERPLAGVIDVVQHSGPPVALVGISLL
jgi:hypothetical protein